MTKHTLTEKLLGLTGATPETTRIINNLFVPVSFRKGTLLDSHESVVPKLFFIETGLVRGYFFYQKEEYTCWILEQGFLIPAAKFTNSFIPMEYIEFLADTSGWSLDLSKAELLSQKKPLLYRILLEIYRDNIREGKIRELMLRIPNAQDRYLFAKAANPNLVYKVINALYASFLNIESKYLFKIKKKLRL